MREQMATKHIPGAQIAVVQHGHIILLEAFGIANLEHRVAVTADTVFPINSATKSFTGVAAMQLVEAGKLDLDAPISRYLEDTRHMAKHTCPSASRPHLGPA
ncbi:serine hydrolase domain-containing protein [Sphingobium yanoikuyae]|jgi:CubicO group peptidase (beta-lactamase class C family)|uniref:serine hydrolase domain-containing protein n=1 Tax=Sphingobium yanoikuyae TaxID=13690 RepID=UPI0019D1D18A|nr:serine hydrolase domain-containing protein [Sphingobium yanoikuyae]